jgi:thiol-disulfide isomerase/thioredoxin
VRYGAGSTEPYLVNFWIVREDGAAAPDLLRYSVASWRYGTATVNGVDALIAVMDSDNNAIFANGDNWSVIAASVPDAPKAVLSIGEARSTSRFMFLPKGDKELVLEFRGFSPDGRAIDFAVVDRMVTKAIDRAPDDMLASERSRPRATTPFVWVHDFSTALVNAESSGKRIIVDFETTWCGPCKSMDEWIWTDLQVAGRLNEGFVGVKLDGDIEKALVKKFNVAGYPTILVLGANGVEQKRALGYQSSKDTLALLAR